LRKRLAVVAGVLVCVLGVTMLATPQRPSATFPVIVVFNDSAPLDQFSSAYRPDDRAQANPAAWDYQNRGVAGAVQRLERDLGFRSDFVYSRAIRGFAARLSTRQISALENNPWISYVEPDGTMTTTAQTLPWGINRIDADISSTLAGNGSGSVTNVRVYIIDTGAEATHPDLNVVNHVNFAGGPNSDCNGHGTHVAGTVAAKDDASFVVGVVPGAPITGVKVLGCGGSGSTSGVIAGVDWVAANAVLPAIANMSLGGGANTSLDDAVRSAAAVGVFFSLSAGNEGANACNYSPARAGAGTNNGIMTVAATSSNDSEPSWSNYGSCVDIWAPGGSILSTYKGGKTKTLSGTSMASPHVGGTAALYLSGQTAASPSTVEAALKNSSVSTTRTSKDGRAIRLVYAGNY
jgi:subtilisin family serine protease